MSENSKNPPRPYLSRGLLAAAAAAAALLIICGKHPRTSPDNTALSAPAVPADKPTTLELLSSQEELLHSDFPADEENPFAAIPRTLPLPDSAAVPGTVSPAPAAETGSGRYRLVPLTEQSFAVFDTRRGALQIRTPGKVLCNCGAPADAPAGDDGAYQLLLQDRSRIAVVMHTATAALWHLPLPDGSSNNSAAPAWIKAAP